MCACAYVCCAHPCGCWRWVPSLITVYWGGISSWTSGLLSSSGSLVSFYRMIGCWCFLSSWVGPRIQTLDSWCLDDEFSEPSPQAQIYMTFYSIYVSVMKKFFIPLIFHFLYLFHSEECCGVIVYFTHTYTHKYRCHFVNSFDFFFFLTSEFYLQANLC